MTYKCPECVRYGMEWDGRAKILVCYFCDYVIRIPNQKKVPSKEQIEEAIMQDRIPMPKFSLTVPYIFK